MKAVKEHMQENKKNTISSELRNKLINLVLKKHKKEYFCHVQFVVKLGLKLAEEHNGDKKVVEISCLLHDIGRDQEIIDETHQEAGKRIVEPLLESMDLTETQKIMILKCILNHSGKLPIEYEEEKIIITADSATKVLQHEAFMLLCKKETPEEKLKWALKFLNSGFRPDLHYNYYEKIKPKYDELNQMYLQIKL